MSELTPQRVKDAYDALMSGDRARAAEYWDPEVRFLTPGNHQYAGWHEGLETFLDFIDKVQEASGGSFVIDPVTILVNDEGYSIDVNRTSGTRAHAAAGAESPFERLQIEGLHLLKWVNGRIVEGRGAIFGDGVTNFNQWWSPVGSDGRRVTV
ncbi:nuclear transport factor 2 family protein [Micromonospora sp. NPDC049101]|uniref:nuclear transport factor 2 family protein n=1 Tax=Micromonospora sp. NPDC049101 TaxID=3155032 RepID=UPI0033CAD374